MFNFDFQAYRPRPCFRKLSTVVALSLSVIIVSASILSLSVTKNKKSVISSQQFEECADKIVETFNNRINSLLLAMDSFSIDATSFALDSNKTWPMVTIPYFSIRAWTLREQMRAETFGLLPVVTNEKRKDWETYVVENHDWVEEARIWESSIEMSLGLDDKLVLSETPSREHSRIQHRKLLKELNFSSGVSSSIFEVNMEGETVVDQGIGPFSPIWMTSPAPKESKVINFNLLSHHSFWQGIEDCMYTRLSVLTRVLNFDSTAKHKNLTGSSAQIKDEPISSMLYPIFDTFEENNDLVALLAAEFYWGTFFENTLPNGDYGVICVVETSCNQVFSYRIERHQTTFLGPGDYHNPKLSRMVQTRGPEVLFKKKRGFSGITLDPGHCPFLLHVYPISTLQYHISSFEIILLGIFVLVLLIIAIYLSSFYECISVRNGRDQTLTSQILSTFQKHQRKRKSKDAPRNLTSIIQDLPNNVSSSTSDDKVTLTNATVMVAEICSLHTWGENKEPVERANLIETVYRSMIVISKRHGISQVEMIDDNFLAILGSDQKDGDHAVILVHFACECRRRISELFKSMSAKEISIRFGVHSGSLQRNTKSCGQENYRFQLFGDTVDTSFEMLKNGKANRIHISVETAELLNLAGKSHWVSPRSETILVKGIGDMLTFWVKPKACLSTVIKTNSNDDIENSVTENPTFQDYNESGNLCDSSHYEFETLVEKNFSILLRYLSNVSAQRLRSMKLKGQSSAFLKDDHIELCGSIIEEARETIQVLKFDFNIAMNPVDPSLIEISQEVKSQLRDYVSSIGSAYRRENSFHNFERASCNVLFLDQMIKKIGSSTDVLHTGFDGAPRSIGEISQELDLRTFSISNDPLLQFAMIFSALINDVDHFGVTNSQLIKEESPLASLYKKQCISEQNSVDISWWLLMKADFDDLRATIYSDVSEMRRFRQALVTSIISTDNVDRKMRNHRENNWKRAFVKKVNPMNCNRMNADEIRNLRATLTVEHIMQVTDSSHYMQSFQIYMKWNERLFEEAYQSYHAGRLEKNPVLGWYYSELANFDRFLLPALSRLADTGVFGGYSEVYLRKVVENRNEWKSGGKVLVQDMVDRFSKKVVAAQEDTICFS